MAFAHAHVVQLNDKNLHTRASDDPLATILIYVHVHGFFRHTKHKVPESVIIVPCKSPVSLSTLPIQSKGLMSLEETVGDAVRGFEL